MSTISDALKADGTGKFLLEMDFDSLKIRLTDQTPASVSNSAGSPLLFSDRISNEFSISQRFDMRVPRYSAPSFNLDIINDMRFQDYEKGRRIDAGTWKIWLWSPSIDWPDIVNYPIAHGVCRKKLHTKDIYSLELVDVASLLGRTITSLSAISGNPADNIISLLQGFSTVDIDYISLYTMKSVLSGFNFSTKVDSADPSNVFDIIDRICMQVQGSRINRFGKVGAVAFDLEGQSVGKISDADTLGRSHTFTTSPLELLVNDLLVYYAPTGDPATWSSITVDRNSNDICQQSYNEYGELPQITVYLSDVSTSQMAWACAIRYLEWRAFKHDVVELDVPFWVGWDFLEGDVGELTLADGASTDGNGWVDEKCILIERSFYTWGMRLKWWRIATG